VGKLSANKTLLIRNLRTCREKDCFGFSGFVKGDNNRRAEVWSL
jgi:hypothetical protein